MIVWPGATWTPKPYEPLFVRTMQLLVDDTGFGEVEMHAFVTLAPDGSRTVPTIVSDCFVPLGVAVRVVGGGVVGVGVPGRSVSVRARVDVGPTVRVGGAADGC